MRKLALVVALVMSWGMLTAPPAAAWEPANGAVFNTPPPWGTRAANFQIVRHVQDAMAKVPARPTDPTGALAAQPEILLTSYLLDGRRTVNEAIAACRRGVSVRIVLDKAIGTKAAQDLISALNSDNRMDRNNDGDVEDPVDQPQTGPCGDGEPEPRLTARQAEPVDPDNSEPIGEVVEELPDLTDRQAQRSVTADLTSEADRGADGSYVTQCKGSCRGGPGSMHTKFYAFSQTGTAKNVIMVSSSNLNAGGALKGWNDMYVMKNRPDAAFRAYEAIHDELGDDDRSNSGYTEVRDGVFTSRFFPMATESKATDPTLADLRQVECTTDFRGRTKINIAMFFWASARGNYLLDRVLQLARQGCVVNIVVGAPSREIAKRLRVASRARQIKVWDSRHFTKNRVLKVRTHNKYTAIKGTYAGNRKAHLVMTGSQNWGHGSLAKSDDSTLNIELGSAYTQYLRHWQQLKKHSIRMAPPR